ncbi:TfoX/Sxy family protein [soil metagenome]
MANDNGFIEHLRELLQPLDGVTIKRMFGGHGVFRHGLMFALVVDDAFYFKVDDQNRPAFEERDLKPWTYQTKAGKVTTMPYYQAPEETLDDSEEMCKWAESAYGVALRAQKPKPKKITPKKNLS